MADQIDNRLRELVTRLADSAPDAPPFPQPATKRVGLGRRAPAWVLAAAGAAAVLIIIGVPFLLFSGGGRDDVATTPPVPITTAPTPTTAPIGPTTTVPSTVAPSSSTTQPATGPYQAIAFVLHDSGASPARAGPLLAPVSRNTGSLEDTVRELMYGLTPSEIDLGMSTAIPEGTELIGIEVNDGVATVDVTAEFDDGGGTFSIGARLAQLVYTVTDDNSIVGVRLALEGTPVEVFSSEGLVLDNPMTRASFESFAPGILVESPAFDAWAGPPLTVSGIAATFEGSFQLEILDTDGKVVADVPFVQTDNGTGWGRFEVRFDSSELPALPATLQIRVYELSAVDGSVINERIQPFGYRMNP